MTDPSRRYAKASFLALAFLCFVIHYHNFNAWFRGDDFTWLGLTLGVHNFSDLLHALFKPMAEGTIRPLSERAFFMGGYALFGLNRLPFRLVIFATQFANLALVSSIGDRITGRRGAGFCAAALWLFNNALVEPLGWICVYNQVLCGFFLLLAFHFLLRWMETGQRRYEVFQWIAFLLGFGAMELNLVYPALAGAYTLLCARKHFRRVLPMAAVSGLYFGIHQAVALGDQNPEYAMHFTGALVKTAAKYWTWAIGPWSFWTPVPVPRWLIGAGVVAITAGLAVFAMHRDRWRRGIFFAAWFAIAIAPVLPLRDHITEYYLYLPLIGVCWLGGWALAETWRAGGRGRLTAVALVAVYLVMAAPRTAAASDWDYRITDRAHAFVDDLAEVHKSYPGQAVVLRGVDSELFWIAIADQANRFVGIDRVYLMPGTEGPADERQFLATGSTSGMPVYDASGPHLREVSAEYRTKIDFGPEWYPVEGNHRWMPRRATLSATGGRKLELSGTSRLQPVRLTVTVDGVKLPEATIDTESFRLSFDLPASGKTERQITLEVDRTFRAPGDARDLGLAVGAVTLR